MSAIETHEIHLESYEFIAEGLLLHIEGARTQ